MTFLDLTVELVVLKLELDYLLLQRLFVEF
jgi:hypothetical protein